MFECWMLMAFFITFNVVTFGGCEKRAIKKSNKRAINSNDKLMFVVTIPQRMWNKQSQIYMMYNLHIHTYMLLLWVILPH